VTKQLSMSILQMSGSLFLSSPLAPRELRHCCFANATNSVGIACYDGTTENLHVGRIVLEDFSDFFQRRTSIPQFPPYLFSLVKARISPSYIISDSSIAPQIKQALEFNGILSFSPSISYSAKNCHQINLIRSGTLGDRSLDSMMQKLYYPAIDTQNHLIEY